MNSSVFSQMPETKVNINKKNDGSFIISSETPLEQYDRCVGDWLEKWADERPHQVFIAERKGSTWNEVSYSEFRFRVYALAQGMINMGLPNQENRPLVILSGNSVDHALVKMAAMHIGVAVSSVSVSYSLMSQSHDRLKYIVEQLNPCAIFVDDADQFKAPLKVCRPGTPIITSRNEHVISGAFNLDDLLDAVVTDAVELRFKALTPDTHAKYLLTSGSTGLPKIVVNTQGMMCANQQMISQYWPFLASRPPKVLDWLPWSHVFGTNHNFNLVLKNGGSFYIDNGKPVPGLIGETVKNIKKIQPNLFFNVPKGYEMLLEYLRTDSEFCKLFFSNLDMLFYAGAALSIPVWDELKSLCENQGHSVFFTTEWGATETSPAITNVHWHLDTPGNIGIPLPGMEIKFLPNGSKLEMRIKGPTVFSEYLHNSDLTKAAFDEDGFYCVGDAGLLQDEEDPSRGIIFNGRVSEDFKLSTGTWVCAANIRDNVHRFFGDLISNIVITGHNRDFLGLLVFPGARMRSLVENSSEKLSDSQLVEDPQVREELHAALTLMSHAAKGSAQKICRLLILDTPPNIELGEITDKGSINQLRMIETRQVDVERIYAEPVDDFVLSII